MNSFFIVSVLLELLNKPINNYIGTISGYTSGVTIDVQAEEIENEDGEINTDGATEGAVDEQ